MFAIITVITYHHIILNLYGALHHHLLPIYHPKTPCSSGLTSLLPHSPSVAAEIYSHLMHMQ